MTELVLALSVLALSHWILSAPGIRPILIDALGMAAFRAIHSLVSLAAICWVVVAYGMADGQWVWIPPPWTRWVVVFAMPGAFWLILARLFERPGNKPVGIYRLTATPGSVGLLIWAGLHLLVLGEARAVLLFGTFAGMAFVAALKNWATAPSARKQVGILPGLTLILGRTTASAHDLRVLPMLLAICLWIVLLVLHPIVIGPDPLAGIVP